VSDEMMFGIAKMPYEMAMGDEMSRRHRQRPEGGTR